MQELNFSVTLTRMSCGECAGTFAINEQYRLQRKEKGGSWNCPYCKTSWSYSESTVNELKRELAVEKNRTELAIKRKEWAEQEAKVERNRAGAYKGIITKIKSRVSKGVCPCCNRTFANLARHMGTQHPDYVER